MNVESICTISAILACLIIIAVHANMLSKIDNDSKMKLEYRCIICAYFIFFFQYVVKLTAGYVYVIV